NFCRYTGDRQMNPGSSQASAPEKELDLPRLERTLRSPRSLFSYGMSALTGLLTLLSVIPLLSVLLMLLWRGGKRISLALFTELPPAAGMVGGGIGNALLGTLLVVSIAALISIPFGVLAALFLAEIGPESKTTVIVRFAAKVLTGL